MAEGKVFFMMARTGDDLMEHKIKVEMSEATGMPLSRVKKRMILNDPDFDTTAQLGLAPGYVGPFAYRYDRMKYIFYVISHSSDHRPPGFVALRFTPTDTLVLTGRVFEPLLVAYALWRDVEIRFLI